MYRYIRFVFMFLTFSCSIDRRIAEVSESERKSVKAFQKINSLSVLKITEEKELGEKLLLCLTFIDKESKAILSDQQVHFYHTSARGAYEPLDPNDESTAWLSGHALTNSEGQIYVETILPGDYGQSGDNRHIHTTVFGVHPEAYDIHFEQYTGHMGKNFIQSSKQHFLAKLKRISDTSLVCFLTLEIQTKKSVD